MKTFIKLFTFQLKLCQGKRHNFYLYCIVFIPFSLAKTILNNDNLLIHRINNRSLKFLETRKNKVEFE